MRLKRSSTSSKPAKASASSSRRNAELGAIHTAARAHKLIDGADRSAYEEMLWTLARGKSAADLDDFGRRRVLDHLNAGQASKPRVSTFGRYKKGTPQALIAFLWSRLSLAGQVGDASDKALRVWCANEADRLGHRETLLEFQPQHVITALINQLKAWCARADVEWQNVAPK